MEYITKIIVGCFSNSLFLVFLVVFVGYLVGRIRIKGIELGAAGVFLTALVFGHFGLADDSLLHQIGLITASSESLSATMSIMQNIGLLCFVTAVGFIAGPNFFHNLKKNAKSYVLMALVIIASGSAVCTLVILTTNVDSAMSVGILSGALTTTPGFAAAQDAANGDAYLINEITVGHAIGYPFGVVGVVLFVQFMPRIVGADLDEEHRKMQIVAGDSKKKSIKDYIRIDPVGLGGFALAIILGIMLGKISIPLPGGAKFALGNTGGALIAALILGHFGHCGPIDMHMSPEFLKSFREFGLILFLIGAGVPGGSGFVAIIKEYGFILFVYGALMTAIPVLIGYFFGKKVVKLCLFDNLGSITGGMTSTPALGALIQAVKTEDVASAYAATYPVALVFVVLASQFMVLLL